MYYGYSYNMNYEGAFTAFRFLLVLGFIASVALTFLGYMQFIATPGDTFLNVRDRRSLAAFLRFDTLLIEKILKVLYLFNAIFMPCVSVSMIIAVLILGMDGRFAASLIIMIGTIVGEVILRVLFEAMMLRVIIARNTSEIKRALGVTEEVDYDGISNLSQSATNSAPSFNAERLARRESYAESAKSPMPAQSSQVVEQSSQPAPQQRGNAPTSALICPHCGNPIPRRDAKFCGYCGWSIR